MLLLYYSENSWIDFLERLSRNLKRLSWRVATYEDLTPSAASSRSFGPSCCLGVLDVSVFDDKSNLVDLWDLCSEDIMVDHSSCRGCR